jgi:hypothetical protein
VHQSHVYLGEETKNHLAVLWYRYNQANASKPIPKRPVR